MIQVVERVCGICSMIHAMCYAEGLEAMMGLEVPPRARFLRSSGRNSIVSTAISLWLGLFADSFGFESLFMQVWKIREKILDINEATAGNRVCIVSVNVIGGVRKDLTSDQMLWINSGLNEVERELKALEKTLLKDYTVQKRTVGKGVIGKNEAYELGLVQTDGQGQRDRPGYAAVEICRL